MKKVVTAFWYYHDLETGQDANISLDLTVDEINDPTIDLIENRIFKTKPDYVSYTNEDVCK